MRILIAPAVLLVAACGNTYEVQPGQWEMTTRFTSVEMPGMPPALAQQMQQQVASQPQVQTTCITPAQAANPAGGMFSQDPQGCTFTEQTFSGGSIRVRGSCQTGQGRTQMSYEGRYTQTTMEGNISAEVTGGPQTMRMAGTMTARRTGDCPAS
jgi:Protein of unknown function (DUF3617)